MLKKLKRILIAAAIILAASISAILLINYHIQAYSSKYILDTASLPPTDAILVLGAYAAPDGQPSDMLKDRLDTALEVHAQSQTNFLVSGDHGRTTYDEVNAMKTYLMNAKDIPDQDIFMDHAGFSTYESLYRAKEIFGVNKVVIVTQRYHLMRAIYVARKLGLEAYGVAADKHIYRGIEWYETREIAARNKDFLCVNILQPKPTFLGESIPISGDGRLTNDHIKQ
ncbi:SanA/YdcF family protein [Paradesulfitobacterium ferrireducens]|uniref:SanA/YdcF family protein n=1 Tax=Paradesulfitobacterium ferrireducens TaxID=2816476 RepID=UPI001A8E735A|nr:ElyC/SanA/YdcF family protein [Paradesulfitobacterium ferrireducens]